MLIDEQSFADSYLESSGPFSAGWLNMITKMSDKFDEDGTALGIALSTCRDIDECTWKVCMVSRH